MSRKKQPEPDATLLADDDLQEYTGLLTELVESGELTNGGTLLSITQMSNREKEYVGAWMVYAGPMIDHSSGRDHAWRKFIFADSDWENQHVFDNVGKLYDFLATLYPLTRIVTYRREGDLFRDNGGFAMSFDLRQWAQINGR